jgi:hypothetical protein
MKKAKRPKLTVIRGKYQFKGYDWTELAECWGIRIENRPEEHVKAEIINYIKERMTIGALLREHDPELRRVANDVRAYVKAMNRRMQQKGYLKDGAGIWRELEKVEDVTLLQYFSALLDFAWTL